MAEIIMGLPKVEVVYCCPTPNFGEKHWELACQFADSLHRFEPGFQHKFTVVSNGGTPDLRTEALFAPFSAEFLSRANIGKDLGAYQNAAKLSTADIMVFLGGSTYIRGANWLKRMVQAFTKHGEGLYGCMANTGVEVMDVMPHLRTTGFWMPPALLNQYPVAIVRDDQRYPFEHGKNCLTSWVSKQGLPTMCVTWQGEYPQPLWGRVPGGFHLNNQEGLIVGDHLSRPPYHHCP